MTISDYVKSLSLGDGETHRSDCPSCRGSNTFTVVNRSGSMIYNCYKLGCRSRGAVHVNLTAAEIQAKLTAEAYVKPEPECMVIPEYVVEPVGREYTLLDSFLDKWDLQGERVLYDVSEKRAVFPIKHKGSIIDAVGRALHNAIPKWYRYTGKASVYKRIVGKPNGTAVIVEDVISAITVAKLLPQVTGLAIMGTSLGHEHMEHIGEFSNVIIALDPDALTKTLQYRREVEAWTGIRTQAFRLDDDIKYRLQSDVKRLREMLL
jgi:hypothetical protein